MTSTSDPARTAPPGPDPGQSDPRSLSANVRRGALWIAASTLSLRLANVLLTAVVAHILSPHDFGVFAVALTVATIAYSFSDLGVSSCLVRADLDVDVLAPTVASVAGVSGIVIACVMAGFATPIGMALGSAAAAGPIRVMSIGVALNGAFAVPGSLLARDFRQDKVFLANAISFVPSTILLIVLAKAGFGPLAFAWSRVVGQVVLGCALIAVTPRYYWPGLARSAVSIIVKFGIPLGGANLVNYVLLNVDYAFVGHFLGAAALGVYLVAFTVASAPYGVLGGVINSISMPAFSRVKHDPVLLRNAMVTALRSVSVIAMPMCAMMVVLARPIIVAVYGAKWARGAIALEILAIYGAVFIVCLLFANMLTGLGRTKFLLVVQLIWIGTLVPAMIVGVHKSGIEGAALAHVVVIVPIVLPSYLVALKRVTGIHLGSLAKAALPALLASAAAALSARVAASQLGPPEAQLIAGLAVGGVVYTACVGRQVLTVFGRERAAERVFGFYGAAARLLGLPGATSGKHARDEKKTRPSAVPQTGRIPGSISPDPMRQAEALRALLTLSRPDLSYTHREAEWATPSTPILDQVIADQKRLHGADDDGRTRFAEHRARGDSDATSAAGRIDDQAGSAVNSPHALPVRSIRAGMRRVRWAVALALVSVSVIAASMAVLRLGIASQRAEAAKPPTAHQAVDQNRNTPGAAFSRHPAYPFAQPVNAAQMLVPAKASAFGPGGLGSGDDPQFAYRAIDPSADTAWVTAWYTSARFGGLQSGTGLLLDMGKRVRISRVEVILGSSRGTGIELRTGNSSSLLSVRIGARASNAGGKLWLTIARPRLARYLLIWLTLLPPDPAGTFQASIYNVRVEGRP